MENENVVTNTPIIRIKGDDIDEYMMAKENSADRNRLEIEAGLGYGSMERR